MNVSLALSWLEKIPDTVKATAHGHQGKLYEELKKDALGLDLFICMYVTSAGAQCVESYLKYFDFISVSENYLDW